MLYHYKPTLLAALLLFAHVPAHGYAEELASKTETIQADLLIVGGSESAVAAAVQGARLGVKSIVLVNDIDWLGGQFTAEAIGAVDEWTIYHDRRAPFARSGQFLEIMDAIEERMDEKYGLARPGNSFCAWTTCEPRETELLFRQFVAPYLKANGGPLVIHENYEPSAVAVTDKRVTGVTFQSVAKDRPALQVNAKFTIDASDWGDVIRLSGAAYLRGPDLQAAFGEPSAPVDGTQVEPNEMNPITYCLVLRESKTPQVIDKPAHYDERRYYGTTNATRKEYDEMHWPAGTMGPFAPAWRDSTMSNGPYGESPTVYTHRRLVDRIHNKLAEGTELVLFNWPLQDYPTYNFPQYVVDALEATEPGAGKKNLVDMTPAQRRIVFQDAKDHALGMLYHLQTTVHDKEPNSPISFRNYELTDEFGTSDRLPPKIYVREGLRLSAMYMLREQDIRDTDGNQSWAKTMVPDSAFGFQFNIDFHPTKRIFWKADTPEVWAHIHSKLRNWGTHTDRACFPLRCLVPIEYDGLLGAGKNLGYTSIVSSAVRLHGHGMAVGQASATLAAVALEQECQPRDVVQQLPLIRKVQTLLVDPPVDAVTGVHPRPRGAQNVFSKTSAAETHTRGLLLWPYQDLTPKDEHFVAANQLATRGILPGEPGMQDFSSNKEVRQDVMAVAVYRAALYADRLDREVIRKTRAKLIENAKDQSLVGESALAWASLQAAGIFKENDAEFKADQKVAHPQLGKLLERFDLPVHDSVNPMNPDSFPFGKQDLAIALWYAMEKYEAEQEKPKSLWLTPGEDGDGDGITDLSDPLPRDKDNDSVPDALEVE